MYGILKKNSPKITVMVKSFIDRLDIADWNKDAAEEYARIRCALESKGTPIDAMDMMIAACAKAHDAILITNNQKHFTNIPGLTVENWQ
jgi:tRNA(fMet)-specific endonuclease VapC